MQQLNSKTVPVNLAAAIQIVSEAIRRRKERNESRYLRPPMGQSLNPLWKPHHGSQHLFKSPFPVTGEALDGRLRRNSAH